MVQLLLLLYGSKAIRRKWGFILLAGLAWLSLGVFIQASAFFEHLRIPPIYFAIPLFLDGVWSFMAALSLRGTARKMRLTKVFIFLSVILLILLDPRHSEILVGILVGLFLVADASWRGASALVVRFEKWPRALGFACFEFIFGLWSLVPWPNHWNGAVSYDMGTLIIMSALGIVRLAVRIRELEPGMPLQAIMSRGWREGVLEKLREVLHDEAHPIPSSDSEEVIVHVWTPTSGLAPLNRGVSRYVAAPDKNGVMSTGHAALELPPDVYISLYPAEEIDRSPSEFMRVLRATRENDVEGVFQQSYEQEKSDWQPSSMQVRFKGLNTRAIRIFAEAFKANTTYNLTDRNCSSSVAHALDAGIDGIFAKHFNSSFMFLARLFLTPEFRVAGFMRHRASAMAWTPGIVLDYVRALAYVVALPERMKADKTDAAQMRESQEVLGPCNSKCQTQTSTAPDWRKA